MSSENLQQPFQMSQNDYIKLLDSLFNREQSPKCVDDAFKLFESNFKTQPFLINVLLDYYYENGSDLLHKKNLAEYSATDLFFTETSKTIIDLLLLVPDDLTNKFFDKLAEKLSVVPTSTVTNITPTNLNNFLRIIDKTIYLLVLLSYRKKAWIAKLATNNLLNIIIKIVKVNSNLNELITVQTCLLFVSIMNTVPLIVLNQHLDNFFQIFICLYKYFNNLEQLKPLNDGICIRNIRWSIRLYFYVCYGLFSSLFLQFLRKREQQLNNKEFLTSILFYLRLHPYLLKDKLDLDKHFKQNIEDVTIEWRQYCLDPLCTNYNQCIQKLLQKTSPTQLSLSNKNLTINEPQFSSLEQPYLSAPPLSPSFIFTSSNKLTSSLIESDSSNKRNSILSIQSSVPNTPNLLNQTFQYPSMEYFKFDSCNQTQIQQPEPTCMIKNLTTHFMMNESSLESNLNNELKNDSNYSLQNKTQMNLIKKKSLSDTNLYSCSYKVFKSNPVSNKYTNIHYTLDDDADSKKQVKSEMRDKNIKEPLNYMNKKPINIQFSLPSRTDSSTNTHEDDSCLSNQTSINNMAKLNYVETNDIISGYFSSISSHQTNTSVDSGVVTKLKQEINHLVLQLIYERHLRNKYEEDSNRLHFIQTERDQLLVEKKFLEKNLKQLVDQYKKEIEECLNMQNKSEINAYKKELDEKTEFIETLQKKLTEKEAAFGDLNEKYQSMKLDNKKLESNYNTAMQILETEKNLRLKNEADQTYIKSLRYTTDLLRKKLLIMSKSQQNLIENFNQEITDLSGLYNSQFTNQSKTIDSSSTSNLFLTPLYQFQQETIEIQQKEIESLKLSYNNLLTKYNEHELELNNLKKDILLKENEVEELKQTLQMDVVDMKGELLKTHHRVQTSLMNVNKHLELEILKLKANLNEHVIKNSKLLEQIEIMKANEIELKEFKLNSLFDLVNKTEKD